MLPPAYFEAIRCEAAADWDALEASQRLAGPWHQMFKQVQSPRHVLSELLQNADDAGATEASAAIVDGHFIFCHNGRDFSEDEFASLCRFGYSNKRALHTIGFRGVGFKSAFSLGNVVRVSTPTLEVAFDRRRFTEPVWTEGGDGYFAGTRITVEIRDVGIETALNRNLQDWLASPASLLFFRNIRTLEIGQRKLRWLEVESGPVSNSTWFGLEGSDASPCLLIRSQPAPFPANALAEIREERILGETEHLVLPDCTVDLLLGEDSRLFVVLPTGVRTKLPFAINAPFIQDSARFKVKEPDSSPTNRWLLEVAAKLAAESMLDWLSREQLSAETRAQAYELMPDVDRADTDLDGVCAAAVQDAFEKSLQGRALVLTAAGRLVQSGNAIRIPDVLLDVWSLSEATRLFGEDGKSVVSRVIPEQSLHKLRNRRAINYIEREKILERLRRDSPSKPQSWKQLLALWSYLADDIPILSWGSSLKDVRIVPIQGDTRLHPANAVVRLGEKRLLSSESDWNFLSKYLLVLNPNWGRFLADTRKLAEDGTSRSEARSVERAYQVLAHLDLSTTSDVGLLMRQVASAFFLESEHAVSECVQLAQVAAKLDATVGPEFRFVTREHKLSTVKSGVVADESGQVSDLVPDSWADQHILHHEYWAAYTSCTRDEWGLWLDSGRSGLRLMPPLKVKAQSIWRTKDLNAELRRRSFQGKCEPHFRTETFELFDIDFEEVLWQHWRELAKTDDAIWSRLVGLLFRQRTAFWKDFLYAKVAHIATTGNKRQIDDGGVQASWILKLRELPCLRDSRGFIRKPEEVMRRTASTEALLDVEPFIPAEIDTEANRPLLQALGVRDTPTGPEQILKRIRALAESNTPPIDELEKWYRRLDSLLPSCKPEEVKVIRDLFGSQPLILSERHGWVSSHEVFLSASTDDLPDTPLIRASLKDLELWHRVYVADRPNAELILKWLNELPKGEPLSADTTKRVKSNLARLGVAAWEECGCWLNLCSELVPTSQLKYSVSMRSLARTQELFPAIKRSVADFQMLDFEVLDGYPFFDVPSLSSRLEEQVSESAVQSFAPSKKPWLECFAKNFARIELPSEIEQARVLVSARRLAMTEWRQGARLETVPYLDGVPAGPARSAPVVWSEHNLFVVQDSIGRMAPAVAREIARCSALPASSNAFSALVEAIVFCFDRDERVIVEYLEQEFKLGPECQDLRLSRTESELHSVEAMLEVGQPVVSSALPIGCYAFSEEPNQSEQGLSAGEPNDGSVRAAQPPTAHREPNRQDKPSLIERFAAARGLCSDGNGKYIGGDGTVLLRSHDSSFPWEMRRGGELEQYLLPHDHCLDRESLTIRSEEWSLLEGMPDTHALIVLSLEGTPTLLMGAEVRSLLEEGRITLYPASYRLART